MELSKKNSIMLKLMANGYSEDNAQDEIYLLQALRETSKPEEFRDICRVLGKAAGLFAVPTLMAFAVGNDPDRSMAAILAMGEISARTKPDNTFEKWDFFSPGFWRSKWMGSQSKFISYVYCISEVIRKAQNTMEDEIDELGARLVREMEFELSPYQSFKELRLCTPDWDVEEDVKKILNDLAGGMLLEYVRDLSAISLHPDRIYEDNLMSMRCDFLLTRLNLNVDYGVFHSVLKAASVLNKAG